MTETGCTEASEARTEAGGVAGYLDPSGQGGNPDATSQLERRGPGRPKGYPKTGGRPKGSKNRRTIEVEKALRPTLPKAKRKLRSLIESDDPEIAYKATALVMAYCYGKPTERREISGTDGGPMLLEFLRSLPA